MEREHTRVHEENKTEAGKVRWVRWVRLDGPDDVGGPVRRRWGQPDEDGDGRTKMGTNPDTIQGDKYGVVAMTLGEFHDQDNQDNLPSMVWDTVGHELSCWGCQKCLHSVTEVTAFHILSNIMSHTRPPVVVSYQFSRFPPSQMSSHQGVVVGLHNVMP